MKRKRITKTGIAAALIFTIVDLFTINAFYYAQSYIVLMEAFDIIGFCEFMASFFMIKIIFSKIREKKQRRYYIPLLCYFMYMMYFAFQAFDSIGLIAYIKGYDCYTFYRCYLRLAEMSLAVITASQFLQDRHDRKNLKEALDSQNDNRTGHMSVCYMIGAVLVVICNLVLMTLNADMENLAHMQEYADQVIGIYFVSALISHVYTLLCNFKLETKGNLKGNFIFASIASVFFVASIANYFLYRNTEETVTDTWSVAEEEADTSISSYFKEYDTDDTQDDDTQDGDTQDDDTQNDTDVTEEDHLTEWVTNYLSANAGKLSGSIAVTVDDKEVYKQAFGYADEDAERAYTTSEVFPLITSTGQFAAASIYQLSEAGKLDINDTLDQYIPEYSYAKKITISDLLYHTSGIDSYQSIYADMSGIVAELYGQDTVCLEYCLPVNIEFTKIISCYPLLFEPGTDYNVSRSDNYLLGLIVERVSGQTFSEYVTEHILEPLDMEETYFDGANITANSYNKSGVYERDSNETWYYCGAGMCTTMQDLLTWQEALFSGEVISTDSLNQLLTVNSVSEMAQGWQVLDCGYRAYAGDSGNIIMQYVNEEYQIQVVAVFNNNTGEGQNVIYDLEEAIYQYCKEREE